MDVALHLDYSWSFHPNLTPFCLFICQKCT